MLMLACADMARACAETMTVTVYLTRAGIKDKGGLEQPDYLNFEIALNKAPDHNLRVRPSSRICTHMCSRNLDDEEKCEAVVVLLWTSLL